VGLKQKQRCLLNIQKNKKKKESGRGEEKTRKNGGGDEWAQKTNIKKTPQKVWGEKETNKKQKKECVREEVREKHRNRKTRGEEKGGGSVDWWERRDNCQPELPLKANSQKKHKRKIGEGLMSKKGEKR